MAERQTPVGSAWAQVNGQGCYGNGALCLPELRAAGRQCHLGIDREVDGTARGFVFQSLIAQMQSSASVTLPVHRKSIATLLGLTHETFYRPAKEIENEGLVRFAGRRIEIVNRPLLEELVE